MRTVGELKEFIKDLDNDMLIVSESNNIELRGAIDVGIYPSVLKFKTEKQWFRDTFDYTDYSKDVYVRDDNGEECLKIK